MPIDWFTVIAQAINFFILVWLLKRFLYHPIIEALDKREQKIADILTSADNTQAQAEHLKQDYEQRLLSFEQQRLQLIDDAKKDAEVSAMAIINDAHDNAESVFKKRTDAFHTELALLQHDAMENTVNEIYAIGKQVLHELADSDLQHKMVSKLMRRINQFDKAQTSAFVNALKESDNKILVRSAFALTSDQVSQLAECIQAKVALLHPDKINLSQKVIPALMMGIELSMNGWKLSWSANQYLASMQEQVESSLDIN